jgi:hypothetical protein
VREAAAAGASVRRRGAERWLLSGLVLSTASVLLIFTLREDLRDVGVPLMVLLNIAMWFLLVLSRRDSAPPLFEIGPICLGFTLLYAAYPLAGYLLAGGAWSTLTDNRLQRWTPDARELGAFAWRYVVYVGAFAAAYLLVRRPCRRSVERVRPLRGAETFVIAWLAAAALTYFAGLWVLFGISYNPSYEDVRLGVIGLPKDLPLLLQQVSHNLRGMLMLLKLCGIAILLQYWRSPLAKSALVLWLSGEVLATAVRMGARTDTVFLLLATMLLYHRLVRPLTFRIAAAAGSLLLVSALAYGVARDFRHSGGPDSTGAYWTTANEFQVLMGTAFDLHKRQETGALDPVPWQVHLNEPLMLIPSQLLPFPKIDPSEWYLRQVGLDPAQIGLMFGVMSQAVVGSDWIELLLRGLVLGALFAGLHAVYLRRSHSFWWTIFYLYLCLWSYYTMRASTFYFVYFVLYRFLPTLIAIIAGTAIVRRALRGSLNTGASERSALSPSPS